MNPIETIMETWVGRSRPISVEVLAREADAGERTVNRWVEGRGVPRLHHMQNMVASTVLPLGFRKAVADYMLRRAVDLRVVIQEVAAPGASPMKITFDLDDLVTQVQRLIHEARHPKSVAGEAISPCEGAHIDPKLAKAEVLLSQLRRAINTEALKETA